MAVIGIHDYDYFTYNNVIPNLECGKLMTYLRKRREIVVLSPSIAPEKYTTFYIRKEYDDGEFPISFFKENVNYGGKAFSGDTYKSLSKEIERSRPIFDSYFKYEDYFGKSAADKAQIRSILNSEHFRLSTDEESIDRYIKKFQLNSKARGIIFHDYNLSKIKGAATFIKELSESRYNKTNGIMNPFPIGNKFPIIVNNPNELKDWLSLNPFTGIFYLEIYSLLSPELCSQLTQYRDFKNKQIYYNVTKGADGVASVITSLPEIFRQVLFFRKQRYKILLTYDSFLKEEPLVKDLIDLFNCFIFSDYFAFSEGVKNQATFFRFCKNIYRDGEKKLEKNKKLRYNISTERIKEIFLYIREIDYELFKMFYEWDSVLYENGGWINGTGRISFSIKPMLC